MKCWAIYCYDNHSNRTADCLFGVYFDKNIAMERYGNGKWTYGKAELKEFEIAPELVIEELG